MPITKHTPVIISPNQKYWAMLESARRDKGFSPAMDKRLVSFDPGETTGMCIWRPDTQSFELYQLPTPNVEEGWDIIQEHLPGSDFPTDYVCEDYKVYAWKADTHKWAGLHTPQLIGAIRVAAHLRAIKIKFRMAQEAKQWATDEKMKMWGIYHEGMKHARDAQRHMITHHFFG